MTFLQGVGVFLIVLGISEFLVFRYLAPRNESIARRIVLLNGNSALNIVIGVVLLLVTFT